MLILWYEVSDMTQVYDMEPPGTLDTKEREKRWGIFLLQQISRGFMFAKWCFHRQTQWPNFKISNYSKPGQRNQMLQRLSDIIPLRATRHDVCSRVPHLPCQVINFEQCGKLDLSRLLGHSNSKRDLRSNMISCIIQSYRSTRGTWFLSSSKPFVTLHIALLYFSDI